MLYENLFLYLHLLKLWSIQYLLVQFFYFCNLKYINFYKKYKIKKLYAYVLFYDFIQNTLLSYSKILVVYFSGIFSIIPDCIMSHERSIILDMHSKLVILCNFSSEFSLLFFLHSILLLSLKSVNMKNNIFKTKRNSIIY